MQEIIKIQITDGKQTVNARDLHSFLGVKKDFSGWIKTQIERARLVENRDYVVFTLKGENPSGGRSSVEYHLTIESGKHISMMSGTDKGYEVRDYFIECEERANNPLARIADPNTRALIQLLADQDALKQEQSRQAVMLEHVTNKVSDIVPAHTAQTINIIQGQISTAAKWYRAVCTAKNVPIKQNEAQASILGMVLDRENVSDIGYIKNPAATLTYLKKLSKQYKTEYDKIIESTTLFSFNHKDAA